MNAFSKSLIILTGVLSTMIHAQNSPEITVSQLTDHIYRLTTDRGSFTTNVIASVGEDGILLVDTDDSDAATELAAVVDSFGMGTPKFIIITHMHAEHVGGNAAWGASPVIIAHDLVRKRMREGVYLFNEYPDEALPEITLTDSLNIYFNGEKIRIIALPGAHVDNEIIIHFTGSKIACVGPLSNGLNFPSIDEATGDVRKYPELVGRGLELLPSDVTIVPGHNDPHTYDDWKDFHTMLVETAQLVTEGLAQGKDCETLQKEDILKDWKSFEGSYINADAWIEYIVNGTRSSDHKPQVFDLMYAAYTDRGAHESAKLYSELKKNRNKDFSFEEFDLVLVGNKVLEKKRPKDAVEFFQQSLKEYPEGMYNWYTWRQLAIAYDSLGQTKQAIESCEKSLEINPESQLTQDLLNRLKKK